MTIRLDIEYINEYAEDDYLEVVFEANPTWEDDSFDYAGTHCTHGASGTHRGSTYPYLDEVPTWDRFWYSEAHNKIIEQWLSVAPNLEDLQDRFCAKLER